MDAENTPQAPGLTFEGMQVADAQLRMHEDTLKVLAVGRQSMAMQLNQRLQSVPALPEG